MADVTISFRSVRRETTYKQQANKTPSAFLTVSLSILVLYGDLPAIVMNQVGGIKRNRKIKDIQNNKSLTVSVTTKAVLGGE